MKLILEIHHYHHADPAVTEALRRLTQEITAMSAILDRLTADVATLTSVDESAIALLNGLAQQIRDNAGDPAALAALADSLEAENANLSAAITANTPAT